LNEFTLREWQNEKLIKKIQYARNHTRFYKNLPEFSGHLEELPFTTPVDIIKDPMAFVAIPPAEVARITTLNTSGTTGAKKRIFFSESDIARIRNYFAVGMKSLVSKGQHVQILISDDTVNSLGYLLRSALEDIGVSANILSAIPDHQAAIAASRNADCLVGMPAEIFYMCKAKPGLRPDSILLTADYVPESITRTIQETWRCEVFTHYGMTETGFGYAVDCACHSGHHTRDAEILVEIIDPDTGQTCEAGQRGEIVLTMLVNEAMPLIRYRTGDRSCFITSPCKCGSSLKRLGRIESRFEDTVYLPGGGSLHINQLDEQLFSFEPLRGYQAALIPEGKSPRLYLIIDSIDRIDPAAISSILPSSIEVLIHYDHCDPYIYRGKRRLFSDLSHPIFSVFR
jgi:phenylacetate-coenzyme A ligase PaaK-like adenylate-forming protein